MPGQSPGWRRRFELDAGGCLLLGPAPFILGDMSAEIGTGAPEGAPTFSGTGLPVPSPRASPEATSHVEAERPSAGIDQAEIDRLYPEAEAANQFIPASGSVEDEPKGSQRRADRVNSAISAGEFLANNPNLHPGVKAQLAASLAPELVEGRRHLERLAMTDELTGLANSSAFRQAGETLESDTPTVVYLDLDNFKGINDTHGHQYGDIVLQTFGDVLREAAQRFSPRRPERFDSHQEVWPEPVLASFQPPKIRIVARKGGDEFVAIVDSDLTARQMIEWVRWRFFDKLAVRVGFMERATPGVPEQQNLERALLGVGVSAGFDSLDETDFDESGKVKPGRFDEVLADADRSLYRDKHQTKEARLEAQRKLALELVPRQN